MECGCGRPLFGRQVGVAGAHGKPVRLAHRRTSHHPNREHEIPDHLPDQEELLDVLLAEVGALWLGQLEELEDHCQDAGEMPRPATTLQELRPGPRVNLGAKRRWVDLIDLRVEQDIDPKLFEAGPIALEGTRVAGEVLVRPELLRVYENADHDPLVLALCPAHQTLMAGMDRPHGGDEADLLPRRAPGKRLP